MTCGQGEANQPSDEPKKTYLKYTYAYKWPGMPAGSGPEKGGRTLINRPSNNEAWGGIREV